MIIDAESDQEKEFHHIFEELFGEVEDGLSYNDRKILINSIYFAMGTDVLKIQNAIKNFLREKELAHGREIGSHIVVVSAGEKDYSKDQNPDKTKV